MRLNNQNESQNKIQNKAKSRDIISSTDILSKFQAIIYFIKIEVTTSFHV